MDYKMMRAIALVLVLALVGGVLWMLWPELQPKSVAFSQMEYTRPDMKAFNKSLQECLDQAESGKSLDSVVDSIENFLGLYYDYLTAYTLADIHYSCDMSDDKWGEEYSFCLQNVSAVDAGLDKLLYALADSPFRKDLEDEQYFGEGFFDSYDGESIWDETFTALMEQESTLLDRYYDASAEAQANYDDVDGYYECLADLADIYVELIALRQQIAAYLDYDSYPQFAYDYYYDRDYTAQQEAELVERIRVELAPLYCELDYSKYSLQYSSETSTFSYVKNCAANMGGAVAEAFDRLEKDGLYDISYSANKYPNSFTTYIYNYDVPFVFLYPDMSSYDQLTFAHEFGHFANQYAIGGSMSVDISEVHSQGMEFMSLFYGENAKSLEQLKLADCLGTYVEQAALASFERQAYGLTGEELTSENLQALYMRVCEDFGFAQWVSDPLEFTTISHFFTNPMYVISYVVSNDAALQLYLREKEEAGSGLEIYQKCLVSEEEYFLAFVESVGLESPFRADGIAEVRQMMEKML